MLLMLLMLLIFPNLMDLFVDKLKLESYEKSNEMISNYNQKIENMELTLRESIRLEFERKYMQDMKEVNAKMMKDMDVLRLENEKTSKLEADKLQQHLVIGMYQYWYCLNWLLK